MVIRVTGKLKVIDKEKDTINLFIVHLSSHVSYVIYCITMVSDNFLSNI